MADQGIKYVHTNLVARDWRKLADFYIQVFDCQPVPPQRDHHGEWLERLTGVEGASLQGIHLRLQCGIRAGQLLRCLIEELKGLFELFFGDRTGLVHCGYRNSPVDRRQYAFQGERQKPCQIYFYLFIR